MSSSTTTALSRQPLVQVLRNVADPRDRRGVRHDLPTVLSLAVTGVLAGCRSLTAIWGAHHLPNRRRPGDPGPTRDMLFRLSPRSDDSCRTWTPQTSTPA